MVFETKQQACTNAGGLALEQSSWRAGSKTMAAKRAGEKSKYVGGY